jgi:hypothetical protein
MMPSLMNQISDRSKLNSKQSWNKLKVAISPVTKEKVYVVTPQPWSPFMYESVRPTLGEELKGIRTENSHLNSRDRHTPRFSIRPTPLYYRNRGPPVARVSPESGEFQSAP